MNILGDFFGFDGFYKEPEGAWSWQHIGFTSVMVLNAILLGIVLGRKFKSNESLKNKTIIVSAIAIDAVEIFKIIIFALRSRDIPGTILNVLPLFLCSLMLIALPLAAFSKGRLRQASLDFILIFGFLAGALGTVGAAQNYNAYPVLAFDNVVSAITHCISCFASIFIGITGMASLKKKNMWITFSMLFIVATLAYTVNKIWDKNYMFLERGDGTPYDIFFNMVNGNSFLYKTIVVGLFVLLIALFYMYRILIDKKRNNHVA